MQAKRGPYGGEAAAILWSSFSPYAGMVGLTAALVLFGLGRLFAGGAVERVVPLLLFAAAMLFVVRIALQSAFGRHDAGLFRNDGSTWFEAFLALGRVLTLNLVWLLPAMLVVRDPQRLVLGAPNYQPGGPAAAAPLLLIAFAVLPPIFLITSVAATRFSDIFSPEHWRTTFRGRAQDVLMLMSVSLGGVLTGSGMVYAMAFGLGNGRLRAMIALGVLAGLYCFGMVLLLVGRLVGGFVRTGAWGAELAGQLEPSPDVDLEASPAPAGDNGNGRGLDHPAVEDIPAPVMVEPRRPGQATVRPAPMAGVTSAVDVALREKLFQSLAKGTPAAAAEPALATVASSNSQGGNPAASNPAANSPGVTPPGNVADGSVPTMPPGMRPIGVTGPVRLSNGSAEHAAPAKGQLANASVLELLRANERTAKTDPAQALQEVAELVAARGRHPQLLARLAVLEGQLHRPQAVHTAKDAAQLACSMGMHGAVAELLDPFRSQLDELALSADDWVKVAHAQKGLKRMDQASALYQRVLNAAPRNLAAIKGLVQIADEHLKQDLAEQALAIYDYLDGQCSDHPFREFTDRGREQAERKLLGAH